jgi:CarD family transcriptional regulator, regulator of rRNA transcription
MAIVPVPWEIAVSGVHRLDRHGGEPTIECHDWKVSGRKRSAATNPLSFQSPTVIDRGNCVNFKKGDTVIYPQHGACVVKGTKKMEAFGEKREYLILETVISEMTLKVPVEMAEEVGVRPPVSADELEDLVAVLAKPDPRVPSNWSRRFKNHQEKLKSGDVYQVAEVVRNLAARNRDASLSAAERTMYERARVNLISEISPALKVTAEEAEAYLDDALAKGVLKPEKAAKK